MIDFMQTPLRAHDLEITVGLVARLERIIGTEAIRQLERTGAAQIPIQVKRELMIQLFGYSEQEADDAPMALLEAELTFFFLQWEMHCRMGRLRSEHSLLSAISLQVETPAPDSLSAISSRTENPTSS